MQVKKYVYIKKHHTWGLSACLPTLPQNFLRAPERCIYQTSSHRCMMQFWAEFLTGSSHIYMLFFFFFSEAMLLLLAFQTPLKQEQATAVLAGGEAWANAENHKELEGNSGDHLVHAYAPRQDCAYPCLLFLRDSCNLFLKSSSDLTVSSGSLCHRCSPVHLGQRRLFFSALQQPFSTWGPLFCLPSAISFLVEEPALNQFFFAENVF